MGFCLLLGGIGVCDSFYRANVVGNLQQPSLDMICVTVVGDVPGKNIVQRIVQSGAHCLLISVVIHGNGIERLEISEMIEYKRS